MINIDDYTIGELKEMLKLINKLKTDNQELKNRLHNLKTNPYKIVA